MADLAYPVSLVGTPLAVAGTMPPVYSGARVVGTPMADAHDWRFADGALGTISTNNLSLIHI